MSTSTATLNSMMDNGAANLGLKLLVTKGPPAQKAVGIWLFGCVAWVFNFFILGGITRLTRSGLSMYDWKFTGKYLQCQMRLGCWNLRNTSNHLSTRGPFAYFIAKGYVTRRLGLRLSALFALGGRQGLIGWWMVKSGLKEPTSEYIQPRISLYRLATHLTSAFVIYCGILWTALSVVMPNPPAGSMN